MPILKYQYKIRVFLGGFKLSITKKMMLFILIPALLAVVALGSAAIYLSRDAVVRTGDDSIVFSTQYIAALARNNYTGMEDTVMSVHDIVTSNPNMDKNILVQILRSMVDRTGVVTVYVGFEDKSSAFGDVGVPSDYDPTTRDWYINAKKLATGEFAYSEVYEDEIINKTVITVSTPIFVKGKLIGVAAIDAPLESLQKLLSGNKSTANSYTALIDSKGVFVSHPVRKTTDSVYTINNKEFEEIYKQMQASEAGKVIRTTSDVRNLFYYSYKLPGLNWIIYQAVPLSDFYADAESIKNSSIVIIISSALLLSAIIFWFVRGAKKSISDLMVQAEEIAEGNLTNIKTELLNKKTNSKDEFELLQISFAKMEEHLRLLVMETKNTAKNVVESSQNVNTNAQQMTEAAQHVTELTIEIAEKANAQAEEVMKTQNEIDEISKGINLVKKGSSDAVNLADSSSVTIENGRDALSALVKKVRNIGNATDDVEESIMKISTSSEKVSQIIDMVMQIAGQTNLLALNAAIEAARAGKHGRGFAVVAEEVRKLAEQSEQAAQEVASLISENNKDISTAVESIGKARPEVQAGIQVANDADANFEAIQVAIKDIIEKIREIDELATQLDQNKDTIIAAIEKVGESSTMIAHNTTSVSAAAEEELASVEEIAASNRALTEMAERMQNGVEKFNV